MTQSQPPITGTTHPLPFDKLSPRDFERLCLWLVQREGYERAEHLGAAGSEQGRDIIAWREGVLWAFQCKRVRSFGPKDALAEVEKVLALPEAERPAGLVFIVTCEVSANTRQQARERCAGKMECHFWAGTELDEKVKRHPDIVEEFFQADQSRMTIVGDSNVVGDVSSVAGITQIEGDVTESIVVTAGRDVIINLTAQITQQMLGDLLEPLRRLTISTLSEIPPEHRLSELLSFLPQEEIARLAKEVLEQSGADYHILFRNIVLDDDTDAAEHTRQGFTALAGSQPKLAMHHFERAIELERGRADAWLGLSWAQYESNLLQEALTSIVEAERLAPALVEKNKSVRASILIEYGHAHSTRNLVQEGIQIFEAILAEDETQAMAWYNLGNAYSALANYKQAVTCFKNAIDLQPDFPDVYVNLGVAYYHLGQHEEELSCYENALKINPDHPQALVSKGATLSIVYDKHDEAIELYEQVLANAPDYCREWPKVWYNLGHACALAGKYKRAYEALSHFRKIDPTVPVEGLLAHVLSTLWRKEPDKYAVEAAESFTRYVAAQPDDRRARFELGEVFYWLQAYDQALEAYPVPDLSSETNATLLDHYGHCLSKSGQQEQSLPYFARAAELFSVYRHCYARQLLFLQRYAEALSNLVEMAEDHQDDPAYLCDLGICYANLEKELAALVAFNQAIDQDEEYADVWYYLGLTCANRHEYRFALATLV